MKRAVVETLSGWGLFRGPAIPQNYEGSFPSKDEAEAAGQDRENEEFWDSMRYLAKLAAFYERKQT